MTDPGIDTTLIGVASGEPQGRGPRARTFDVRVPLRRRRGQGFAAHAASRLPVCVRCTDEQLVKYVDANVHPGVRVVVRGELVPAADAKFQDAVTRVVVANDVQTIEGPEERSPA